MTQCVNRWCIIIYSCLLGSASCGYEKPQMAADPPMPQLVKIDPDNGSQLANVDAVEALFTTPIDRYSVTQRSFQVVPVESLGRQDSIPGQFEFSDADKKITWRPVFPLEPNNQYVIILTHNIVSIAGGPLNAAMSHFTLARVEETFADSAQTVEEETTLSESPVQSDPNQELPEKKIHDDEIADRDTPSQDDIPAVAPEVGTPHPTSGIRFTEVVTDPQQDWNDSSGGNGIPFDEIPGDGTVGSTDEWIEMMNASPDTVNLAGWHVEIVDGTDEVEYFSDTSTEIVFSNAGSISAFSPEERMVIGNPAGSVNNAVTLRLYDENDNLIDEIIVDDANANDVSDESWQLLDDGSWNAGQATINF